MTGFGRGEVLCQNKNEELKIVTEIKSVNHRFKDFKFRIPSYLNCFEVDLKSALEKEFSRGSFEVTFSIKKKHIENISIDTEKVDHFLASLKPVLLKNKVQLEAKATDFLRAEFAKEMDSHDFIQTPLLESLGFAMKALKSSRKVEGDKLVEKIKHHLNNYKSHLSFIEKRKNEYPQQLKEKLLNKLNQKLKEQLLAVKLDESRFAQEVIYYLEKLEIDEEINRALIHTSTLKNFLDSDGDIGRKIDFLLQELGRETNTIGSKSSSADITNKVVEMKLELEKMREQALNLE